MNSNTDDEKLDALLDQWADQCVSSERLVNLQKRIVSSLQETKFIATGNVGSQESRRDTQRRVARNPWASRFAVGTVVMMLLTVGFVLPQLGQPVVSPTFEAAPEYAWLQEEQIQNKFVLLMEMESLFDRQLAWMAETENRLEFGLDRSLFSHTDRSPDPGRFAVRVIVEQRQQGTTVWQSAWAMDVVSRNEEFVRVTPSKAYGHELQVWTYRLPDGAIAVESVLQLNGTSPFRARASGLHQNTKPLKVVTAQNNGTEYRVFQTVAVLDGKVI
jgi:hypothetical protein